MKLTADNIRAVWQWTLFVLCVAVAVWFAGNLTDRMNAPALKPVITQPQQQEGGQR